MPHDDDAHNPRGFLGFVEKKITRIVGVGLLGVLLLMNLILAIIALRGTHEINAPLGIEIFLTIVTALYCGILVWKPITNFTKKMGYVNFGLSALTALVWFVAFLWLTIAIVRTGKTADNQKEESTNAGDTANPARRALLFTRQDPPAADANAQPAKDNRRPVEYGCVVLSIFFALVFLFNTIYIQVRMKRLYPKYAELNDDNAFDARIDHNDEEHELGLKDNHNPNDTYREETYHEEPLHADDHDRIDAPPRTGYTPHGYMEEQTEYRPDHHQPGYAPPQTAYGQQEQNYTPYYDDNNARAGQWQQQR